MRFEPYGRILTLLFLLISTLVTPQLARPQETPLTEEEEEAEEIAKRVDTIVEPILRVEDARMILEVDALLRTRVYLRSGTHARRLTTREPPPFVDFVLRDEEPLVFESDGEQVHEVRLNTEMGVGKRVTCVASAPLRRGTVEVRLHFDQYEDHPGIVAAQAEIRLAEDTRAPVFLESSTGGALELFTRKRQGGYWYFQGFGEDGDFRMEPLPPGFQQENSLPSSLAGHGAELPLVDVWFPRGGLATGFLELGEEPLSLAVEADDVGTVLLRMKQEVGRELNPGESWKTPQIFISVHEGDFFESLRAYGRWMASRYGPAPAPNRTAYQPRWGFDGVGAFFSLEDLRGELPVLKDLGVRWIVMDQRWFEGADGRNPRPELLPEEGGFKQVVEEIHREGFLVRLRLSPIEAGVRRRPTPLFEGLGESPTLTSAFPGEFAPSPVPLPEAGAADPEWFVLDPDGQPVLSARGNPYLCPALIQVQAFVRTQAGRWFMDWGVDAVEQDNTVRFPFCFHPAHEHSSPQDSRRAFPRVQQILANTARVARAASFADSSSGASIPTRTWTPCVDPRIPSGVAPARLRLRLKVLRALCGEAVAVVSDSADTDQVASSLGLGTVPGIRFSTLWPEEGRKYQIWLGLDRRLQISRGQYLNSYDLAFNVPEGHLVRRYGLLYYSFFVRNPGDTFKGRIRFRGLTEGLLYRVFDYWNLAELGVVTSRRSRLSVEFQDFLLLQLKPESPGSREP